MLIQDVDIELTEKEETLIQGNNSINILAKPIEHKCYEKNYN